MELYRPILRLVAAGWVRLIDAKRSMTMLEIEQLCESLDAYEEARLIQDWQPPQPPSK